MSILYRGEKEIGKFLQDLYKMTLKTVTFSFQCWISETYLPEQKYGNLLSGVDNSSSRQLLTTNFSNTFSLFELLQLLNFYKQCTV